MVKRTAFVVRLTSKQKQVISEVIKGKEISLNTFFVENTYQVANKILAEQKESSLLKDCIVDCGLHSKVSAIAKTKRTKLTIRLTKEQKNLLYNLAAIKQVTLNQFFVDNIYQLANQVLTGKPNELVENKAIINNYEETNQLANHLL